MVARALNPSTREAETVVLEFKASLMYIVRSTRENNKCTASLCSVTSERLLGGRYARRVRRSKASGVFIFVFSSIESQSRRLAPDPQGDPAASGSTSGCGCAGAAKRRWLPGPNLSGMCPPTSR